MLSGAFVTIVWANVNFLQALVTERLVSFVVAFAAVILFSMLKPDKTDESVSSRSSKAN
jgi:hypothetical protein